MENPEEVLQALDEFQKVRPAEIPRELEEYLSWVAKTGDPVYQWSLVKPLFREKLTRVMTDFYENCPSLELTPCPNVEQFNYDIMKGNLLELLESFANAPFTVQRICELLTAPRKQYNRVDKFMRAIEKNILVVSTIEPGPAARRSENGDGMVNGSLDEETLGSHSSHEVEMESWVKDCTTEGSTGVSSDAESPLLESVITDGDSASTVQSEDTAGSRVASLPENGTETTAMTSEVPAASINEDTNSQPSLDSDMAETEYSTSQKLQTTFRTKDFAQKEENGEEARSESENSRLEVSEAEGNPGNPIRNEEATKKSTSEAKSSYECQDSVEGNPEKRARIERLIDDLETIDAATRVPETEANKYLAEKSQDSTIFSADSATSCEETETTTTTTETTKPAEDRLSGVETTEIRDLTEDETTKKEETDLAEDSLPDHATGTTDNPRPIIEEPAFDEASDETANLASEPSEQESSVTIEEAMDEDTRVNRSIVPDPIPIVEEPKESEPSARDAAEIGTIITELPEMATNSSDTIAEEIPQQPVNSTVLIPETNSIESMNDEIANIREPIQEDITDVRCPEDAAIDEKVEQPAAESMEIDGEECMPSFHQDEPMEQEPGDMLKS